MQVNYYYDFTPDAAQRICLDPEGQLVPLCRQCVEKFRALGLTLIWASQGDTETECQECDQKQRENV